MSYGNKDYFTEMVKLITGLGIVAIVIVFGLIFLLGLMDGNGNANDVMVQQATNERIKAIETVAEIGAAAPAPAADISGADIVSKTCAACHATGILESPKVGDKDAWQKRLDANGGLDGLVKSAIAGKGAMPPKGGASNLNEAQLKAAIEHMIK